MTFTTFGAYWGVLDKIFLPLHRNRLLKWLKTIWALDYAEYAAKAAQAAKNAVERLLSCAVATGEFANRVCQRQTPVGHPVLYFSGKQRGMGYILEEHYVTLSESLYKPF